MQKKKKIIPKESKEALSLIKIKKQQKRKKRTNKNRKTNVIIILNTKKSAPTGIRNLDPDSVNVMS